MSSPVLRRPRVAMVVQNSVSGDTRVKKMAMSAASAGCEVVVYGFSTSGLREESRMGDVRIVKLAADFRMSRRRNRAVFPLLLLGYRSEEAFLLATDRRNLRRQRLAARLARTSRYPFGTDPRFAATLRRLSVDVLHNHARVREVLYRLRRSAYQGRHSTLTAGALSKRIVRRDLTRNYRKSLAFLEDYELALGPELDAFRPDLVHAHDFFTLAMVANSIERLRADDHSTRWVYDAHEYVRGLEVMAADRHRAALELERRHLLEADAVITVTDHLAQRLREDYGLPEAPAVVMNAPALAAFDASGAGLRRTLGLAPDVPLLVYTGQVKPPRDIHTLVQALASLPGVHLAILTNRSDSYVRNLSITASRGGYGERLHLLPYVDSHRVSSFVADATMGVIPLTHYGNAEVALPTKLFEFMHARLPVAVSDTEAMRTLVTDLGIGEVFPAGDPEGLARAVRHVLADLPAYRRPLEENPDILRRYSWEEQERLMSEVYRGLLGDRLGVAHWGGRTSLEETPIVVTPPAPPTVA